jgi:hypothetical protein
MPVTFIFNHFSFTKLINTTLARNFEFMLRQTLKYSVYNSVVLRSAVSFYICFLVKYFKESRRISSYQNFFN